MEQLKNSHWDAIIIGGGMGGGATAYALASSGKSVLLIEKGTSSFSDEILDAASEVSDPDRRLGAGLWPEKLSIKVDGISSQMWAPLGCGIGGSSLIYAAALNRLDPTDFESRPGPDGRELVWPIDYATLHPYYTEAERLFGVSGSRDPLFSAAEGELREPPELSNTDRYFFGLFESSGLHPYRLHTGFENIPGCAGCGGKICKRKCKNEARTSCIDRALETTNLEILENTIVSRIKMEKNKAAGVVVGVDEEEVLLTANVYVLAAGAYFSPVILLNSRSELWENGVGNRSDQVGRNLMFHVAEHIGIWPKNGLKNKNERSTLALRDFYCYDGIRFGEFQSTGISAGYGNILYYLQTRYGDKFFGLFRKFSIFLKVPALIAAKLFKNALVFACIIEDYPYKKNRVVIDTSAPNGMRVEYTIPQELTDRVHQFRSIFRKIFKGVRYFPSTHGIWLNFGHPCGTCRAGNDPATSVVDKNCKIHEINNVYISDASVFPTSGGTNPSLTIAANGLRVGYKIAKSIS